MERRRLTLLGLFSAMALASASCRESVSNELRLLGPAQPLPIPEGSPLVLLASKSLATHQCEDSLVVTDAQGRLVSCQFESVGPHLLLHPRATKFCIRDAPYSVSSPWPPLGGSLMAADGERLHTPFHLRVDVRAADAATETLRLLPCTEPIRLQATSLHEQNRRLALALTFTASVDPQTLESGIQVIDASRRETLPGVQIRVDDAQPQRVVIEPFATSPWLCAQGRYRVEILDTVRSQGGLAATPDQCAFEVDAPTHLLQFDFTSGADVADAAKSQVKRDGLLLPTAVHTPVLPTDSGTLVPLGGQGLRALFARAPQTVRAQLLIPATWFRASMSSEDEAARRLITEIDLLTDQPVPADLVASRMVVRLHQRNAQVADGLGDVFDENLATGELCPLLGGSFDGMTPLAHGQTQDSSRILRLRLAEPHVVDVRGGDLVLSIEHDGVWSLLHPIPDAGITVLGSMAHENEPGPTAYVLAPRNESRASERSRAQPHVWIQTVTFPHVSSAWKLLPQQEQPLNFRREQGRHLQADAVEGRHFTLRYVGGSVRRSPNGAPQLDSDGMPVCDAVTTADQVPPRKRMDALRLVVEWLPSAELLRSSPSIEYILVAWK